MQRATVSVYSSETKEAVGSIALPSVFSTPIRTEIVQVVHANALKNLRQPYAVSAHAGEQTSAESWGTGRAVARIPRVSGGGTHRAGQGAFGNMCRKGRMFAPTKVWRRWSHVIKQNERRYAVASAIAASSVAPVVMSRGHKIERTKEIPLVLSNDVESYTKTKQAAKLLRRIGVYDDVKRVKDSKQQNAGKGHRRNRRFKQRRGPLVIYKNNNGVARAFRNIPGVEVCSVDRLSLLQLAPGGKVGRFIIWTQAAFEDLQKRFGSLNGATGDASLKRRGGVTYRLPRPQMANTDVTGLLQSDAIQNVARPIKIVRRRANATVRRNPLKNHRAMQKLNPYFFTQRRKAVIGSLKKDQAKIAKKVASRAALEKKIHDNFYQKYIAPIASL